MRSLYGFSTEMGSPTGRRTEVAGKRKHMKRNHKPDSVEDIHLSCPQPYHLGKPMGTPPLSEVRWLQRGGLPPFIRENKRSTWRFIRRNPIRHCGSNCPNHSKVVGPDLSIGTLPSAVRTFLIPAEPRNANVCGFASGVLYQFSGEMSDGRPGESLVQVPTVVA